jgi:Large-conductance mechanosensitive channel, MscL
MAPAHRPAVMYSMIYKEGRPMSIVEEFKQFAVKGNVMDLAIGVIIGGAFSTIVNSVVKDLIMPIVGVASGGLDFSNKFVRLGNIPPPSKATRIHSRICRRPVSRCSATARSLPY